MRAGGCVWVGCPPRWMSGSPNPIPLPWGGKCVWPWSQRHFLATVLFMLFSHRAWPPWRVFPGQGQVWPPHKRGSRGVDLHLLALGTVSSPLCILPAAPGEACAPGPRLPSPTRTVGGKDRGSSFWGQNLRVKGLVTPGPLHPGTMVHSLFDSPSPGA